MLDLATYYTAVSPWLLPHVERRPAVFETYKGTIDGPNSFEQDPPAGTPRWIKRTRIRGRERCVTYVVPNSAATLVYLVSIFMVTLHVWQSSLPRFERPDVLLFDLDPLEGCTLAQLARTALRLRGMLAQRGIVNALVKTSGARGLHVWVPIRPVHDFAAVRAFVELLAREMARRYPHEVTAERDPRRRTARTVYVDWGQMGRGMSIVPPYVPRACPQAPVSMPLAWEQIETFARSRSRRPPAQTFAQFSVANVPGLLKQSGDLWANQTPQPLLLEG